MPIKFIGPKVERGEGMQKDNSSECPTGWCDDFNGQFANPRPGTRVSNSKTNVSADKPKR